MYGMSQIIQHPYGISTFGSAIIRVAPDIASLRFTVSRIEKNPTEAFKTTREFAKKVKEYLKRAEIHDVGSSRITLSQEYRYSDGENQFIGYAAKVVFHVVLHDLDLVEEILIGVVDAGTNEVNSVTFHTEKLKEVRAEARRRAVAAAKEKALIYCAEAGVELGNVLHIEDISPDVLTGRNAGHVQRDFTPDDDDNVKAFDPGVITVGGAVMMAFTIQ